MKIVNIQCIISLIIRNAIYNTSERIYLGVLNV